MSEGRHPDGKWTSGFTPPGAKPFVKGEPNRNPGGRRKTEMTLIKLARQSVPDAFAVARQILLEEKNPNRDRLDAARFLTVYGLGAPPKLNLETDDGEADAADAVGQLTVAELRELARQSLQEDAASEADEDAGDDESDESVN